jgi:hypothetical protein
MTRTAACVVCEAPIVDGAAQYANAWERTRKRYPCCSPACAQAFDPDLHWLPAVLPEPAGHDEGRRLLGVLRARLQQGDQARVVVREMLLAGVAPEAIRGAVVAAMGSAEAATDEARQLGVFNVLSTLVGGGWLVRRKPPADLDELRLGIVDLDAWQIHLRR